MEVYSEGYLLIFTKTKMSIIRERERGVFRSDYSLIYCEQEQL